MPRLGKAQRLLRREAFATLDSFKDQGVAKRKEIERDNLSHSKPDKPVLSSSWKGLGNKSPRARYPYGNLFKGYPKG